MTTAERKPIVLTSQEVDFPRWYQDVLDRAQLAENGPVRGTMIIHPYGYALWERIQSEVDKRIKAAGASNVYMPLFIPEEYLQREAQHIEGFSPELAVVTHAGGKELAEPIVVRPTSETLFGIYMAKQVQSYRDLPLLLNQWSNVVRWELRPRLFLRTSEFLWQEGHTAHASGDDAARYARMIHLSVYRDFLESVMACPVHVGVKTKKERFAGAVSTLTCEAMMRDGKSLQMATSHEFGENFARAFGIRYSDKNHGLTYCSTTSWGSSTRMIGGLIMVHGDDSGLVLPPELAPIQVIVLAIQPECYEQALSVANALEATGIRCSLDNKVDSRFGRRVTDAELKGIPIRIEIGLRDLASESVTLATRHSGVKRSIPLAGVEDEVRSVLAQMQQDIYVRAEDWRNAHTVETSSLEVAREAARTGFARLPWRLVREEGERQLSDDAISVRCLQTEDGSLPEIAFRMSTPVRTPPSINT